MAKTPQKRSLPINLITSRPEGMSMKDYKIARKEQQSIEKSYKQTDVSPNRFFKNFTRPKFNK